MPPTRLPLVNPATTRRVKALDRLADGVIRLGGVSVILAVAAIFIFIARETIPLFGPARAGATKSLALPTATGGPGWLLAGIDEYETYAYALSDTGGIQLLSLKDGLLAEHLTAPSLSQHALSAAARGPTKDYLYFGTRDGYVVLAQLKFKADYTSAGRAVSARLVETKLIQVAENGSAVTRIFGRQDSAGTKAHVAVACADGRLYHLTCEEGEEAKVEAVEGGPQGGAHAVAMDGDGKKFFALNAEGRELYEWQLEETVQKPSDILRVGEGDRRVESLDLLIGNNSLVLGFNDGSIEQWFGVHAQANRAQRTFASIRSFEPLDGPVTALQTSGRDRGFLAGSAKGMVRLYFSTSERTMLTLKSDSGVTGLSYSPKLTAVLALNHAGSLVTWEVSNPHPEISWRTLFGRVWYEGYDQPGFTWQSSGGSDDFESKLSLVPLTLGTFKGAIYGLLFAIPIAVLAALYTSQFMSYRLRSVVKPTVEIMAALPSVVIGFLAGLWLAPLLEHHTITLALTLLFVPLSIFIASNLWQRLPTPIRSRLPAGMELLLVIPVVGLSFLAALAAAGPVEAGLFHGEFRQWVFNTFGQQFEQRNSIVIGVAMGFAVIPLIFTISEDALSNVPRHFVSGSLALGASRWQTAIRIILPTASPGIFSAVMVGFGRAVGETMIVLMATGNTPILSFSPFNGMRTLSANIAVEIPEAPVAGTLYRVLFLAAVLLFVLTFVVNTIAELIRQRLREKYKSV